MKTQHVIITDTATGESFAEKHKIGRGGMGGTVNLMQRLADRIGCSRLDLRSDVDEDGAWSLAVRSNGQDTGRRLLIENVCKL